MAQSEPVWPQQPVGASTTDVYVKLDCARDRYRELPEGAFQMLRDLGVESTPADTFLHSGDISPEGAQAVREALELDIFTQVVALTSGFDFEMPLLVAGVILTLQGPCYFEVYRDNQDGYLVGDFYSHLNGARIRHEVAEWFRENW